MDEVDVDWEQEYAMLYQAVLGAGAHVIDGPDGRKIDIPLDVSTMAGYECRDAEVAELRADRDRLAAIVERLYTLRKNTSKAADEPGAESRGWESAMLGSLDWVIYGNHAATAKQQGGE